jgi:AraC-like DNA-binding protein
MLFVSVLIVGIIVVYGLGKTMHNFDDILKKYILTFSKLVRDGVIDIDHGLNQKFDFWIARLEQVIPELNGVVPPFRQSLCSITLVKEGNGIKNIGECSFAIQDRTLFVVPNREVHSSVYHSTECTGYVLFFNIDFFHGTPVPQQCISGRKIFKQLSRPYLYLDAAGSELLSSLFECILDSGDMNRGEWLEVAALKIFEIALSCDRFFTRASLIVDNDSHHTVLEKFSHLLDIHFRTNREVQFFAASLNIHPNHLNFLLKKHCGKNAKQYINNKIVSESKYLLSNSGFMVKEIAYFLGFDDANNFSTFFQKVTGLSPSAYRNSVRRSSMEQN